MLALDLVLEAVAGLIIGTGVGYFVIGVCKWFDERITHE